ncbi:MAG: peptide deformylase [Saprospirales bacterium]|nr:peptide deformylase [Saprospirales bacterium]|tara:strand:- start:7144 stop:7653 length:510 start_codon:yes stop_codon:yes gene_type:complete
MELIYAPSEWLSKAVKPFDFDKHNAVEIAQNMVDIMDAHKGIGISANQVGIDAQIFVMQPTQHDELKEAFAIINPVIEKISEETDLRYEGCLSHPNLFLKVQRPVKLVTRFLDADAKECIIVLNNYDARVFLHEYDHLQGIEFTDRVSKLKLEMAKKKKTKREKRYING